jgi:hypothetical protein
VVVEADGSTVRKVFHGPDQRTSLQFAEREFEIMSRFHEALRRVPFATCPRPLELVTADEVYLRMERAAGVAMQDHLHESTWAPKHYQQLAELLGLGLTRYVDTFHEPYWDFIFRNMLYDAQTGVVTFVDFGLPALYLPLLDDLKRCRPIEVSLAALVASAIFEAARPKRMTRRREHRHAFLLAKTTVERLAGNSEAGDFSVDVVRDRAGRLYALACGHGGGIRREWYRLGGRLLSRPSAKLAELRL